MQKYNYWKLKENEKICAFDLDDVLAHSIEAWLDFVNKYIGRECYSDLNEMKNDINYNEYRNLKLEYRESGVKENIRPIEGAAEILKALKNSGYTILIMTARPFDVHKTLFKQTINWLRKNNMLYDGIIWGKDKHVKVITQVENLKFMVEDNRYIANQIGKFGFKCYLLSNEYNEGSTHKNVIRIKDLKEILKNEI